MRWSPITAAWLMALSGSALSAPTIEVAGLASPPQSCRQGQVEILFGGGAVSTTACAQTAGMPAPMPTPAAPSATPRGGGSGGITRGPDTTISPQAQAQRDTDRQGILLAELRREQLALATIDRQPASLNAGTRDDAARARVVANIAALQREMQRDLPR